MHALVATYMHATYARVPYNNFATARAVILDR